MPLVELMPLFGTITGFITSWFQRKGDLQRSELDLKSQESKQRHELEMLKAQQAFLKEEYASRVHVAAVESETAINIADAGLQRASMVSEPKMFSLGGARTPFGQKMFEALDVIRGLVRPGLTVYISVAQGVISVIVLQAVIRDGSLNTYALAEQCLGTLSYSMNACISHYFGTRNKASEAQSRKK